MRLPARLATAALACVLLTACGDRAGDGGTASDADGPSEAQTPAPAAGGTAPTGAIPDDFPLSAGMGGPQDTIPTSRTGTGLRDLTLCGTAPLRRVDPRDRLVADNSGGESADTRELVLLGSPEEAAALAEAVADLPAACGDVEESGGTRTRTDVRDSPLAPAPAATLVRTYAVDGRPATGMTVVHVVPAGAAVLVTSTYAEWEQGEADQAVRSTVAPLADTVAALAAFGDGPGGEPTSGPTADDDGPSGSVLRVARVGSARLMFQTYGEGSLASRGSQADGVTETTVQIVRAMCVFTKTGC